MMTETSDDGWTDWIPHDGGPCPIPWAKAGEYEIGSAGGGMYDGTGRGMDAIDWSKGEDWWRHKAEKPRFNITAYRVRADLAHRLAPAESAGADDGWRLEKRPTAFLVSVPSAGDYLFRCEAAASAFAEDRSVEYRGLYLREPPATTPTRPIAEAAEEMARALDHPILRDLLGRIEDSGPKDAEVLWLIAMSWMDERDAALAAYRAATRQHEGE